MTMLVSLEALAMAGASDVECAMDIEEWERKDLEQYPPPHLLAQEEEEERNNGVYGLPNHNTWECHKEEEHGVTFTNHQEKLDSTIYGNNMVKMHEDESEQITSTIFRESKLSAGLGQSLDLSCFAYNGYIAK
ncbi:hypothetical protein GmHk_11G033348 [Glycine max]|nr:hypothetical protein GmHk_11G033348 [Glycine max]